VVETEKKWSSKWKVELERSVFNHKTRKKKPREGLLMPRRGVNDKKLKFNPTNQPGDNDQRGKRRQPTGTGETTTNG